MKRLTHLDSEGNLRMVDVGDKPLTNRQAVAEGTVRMSDEAFRALRDHRLSKGDALTAARFAGIQAAKRTSEWIPLCHPIPIHKIEVECRFGEAAPEVVITATAAARWSTGVEMEALTAVAAAALTVYDMCKSVDRSIVLTEIRLLEKTGGKSGRWQRVSPGSPSPGNKT
ncbi:MAG: cyclic pyranopterin monophosphate synthase MoaC [Acidobacteriota bacterium]